MRRAALNWGVLISQLCVGVAVANGPENHWSRFRGPNGTGVQSGVQFPVAWGLEDYRWQVELPGRGHSSPVVWEDRAFLTCADEAGNVTLLAIRVSDGKEEWRKRFAGEKYPTHNTNTLASCSAAVDAERVYQSLASPHGGEFVAVSHEGDEVWRRRLGSFDSHHGSGISPIVHGDLVFLACDHEGESFVTALETATGETRWQIVRRSGKASYATPAIWRSPAGEEQLIVNSTAEGMTALSLADGQVLWQLADLFPQRCVGSPLLAGGYVLASSGGGSNGYSMACVRPSTESGAPAAVVYELKKSVPQVPTPVALGDLLFVVHDRGMASCRDLATGEEYWTQRLGNRFSASPICVGGRVYCTGEEGTVIVLAAEKEFRVLGEGQFEGIAYATPAVAGDNLLFRTESRLYCLAAEEH